MPSKNQVKQRHNRADKINARGVTMSHAPCTRCFKKGLQCRLGPGSRRCGECNRAGVSCQVEAPTMAQWDRLKKTEDKLNAELKATAAVMQETLAKHARLLRQQEEIKDRAAEMWRRGVDSLDALDELEEADRRAAEEEARKRSLENPVPDPFDFSLPPELDPGTLAFLDSQLGLSGLTDETPQVSRNN